jgi:hypothetical protein
MNSSNKDEEDMDHTPGAELHNAKIHVLQKSLREVDAVVTHSRELVREATEMAWMEIRRMKPPPDLDANTNIMAIVESDETNHNVISEELITPISSLKLWSDMEDLRSNQTLDSIQYDASKLYELSDEAERIVAEVEASLKDYLETESAFQREYHEYTKLCNVGENRLKAIKKSLNRAQCRANKNIWQDCESIVQDLQGSFQIIKYATREEMDTYLSQDFFKSTTTLDPYYESLNKATKTMDERFQFVDSKNEAVLLSHDISMTILTGELHSLIHSRDSLLKELEHTALNLKLDEELQQVEETILLNMKDSCSKGHVLSSSDDKHESNNMDVKQNNMNHNNSDAIISQEHAVSHLITNSTQSADCNRPEHHPMSNIKHGLFLLQKCAHESRKRLEPWVVQMDENITQQHELIKQLWSLYDSYPTLLKHQEKSRKSTFPNHDQVLSSLQFIHSLQQRLKDAMEFYDTILPSLVVFQKQITDCIVRSAIHRSDFETNMQKFEHQKKQSIQDEEVAAEQQIQEIQSLSHSTIMPVSMDPSVLHGNDVSSLSSSSVHVPAGQSSFVANDTILVQFLTMDFPYDDVIRALQQSDNNFDLALSYLLQG